MFVCYLTSKQNIYNILSKFSRSLQKKEKEKNNQPKYINNSCFQQQLRQQETFKPLSKAAQKMYWLHYQQNSALKHNPVFHLQTIPPISFHIARFVKKGQDFQKKARRHSLTCLYVSGVLKCPRK